MKNYLMMFHFNNPPPPISFSILACLEVIQERCPQKHRVHILNKSAPWTETDQATASPGKKHLFSTQLKFLKSNPS